MSTVNDPPPPSEWPKAVSDLYVPERVIGKGGFASVWMARKKTDRKPSSDEDHVAIKVMQDDGYSKREVSILSELSEKYAHPNIVKLLGDFSGPHGGSNGCGGSGAKCVVLSLARGPTLNYILTRHGALGLVVAQSISRQLIDAVAFLHGHAVIHRDIQPCNIIVSGALVNDDLWWEDSLDVDGKVLKMAKQCQITIVDFGFARALSPDDIKSDTGLKKICDEGQRQADPEKAQALTMGMEKGGGSFCDVACIDQALIDTSRSKVSRGRSRRRSSEDFDSSISHQRIRDLSALGTRNYAAPEILSGIRNFADVLGSSLHSQSGSRHNRQTRKTLGKCVSNYGMDADAFSVGATIRHMVTGVPPSIDVEEFIASKNHPMKKMLRRMKKSVMKTKKKRVKKYRPSTDLPAELRDLIQMLTHYDSRKRATIRASTSHPWINMQNAAMPERGREMEHGGPVVYLQCGEDQ